MNDLIIKLHSIGAIKFGSFEIKKDFLSPFQVDFSVVISHPTVAKEMCAALTEKMKNLSFDLLCGVPVVGACFANYIAWENEVPLIALRTDGKSPKVQGSYKSGQRCLLLQDILLSGMATLDATSDLEDEGVEVRDILAFFDLGLGGKKKIKGRGYLPHCLIDISEAIQILFDSGKL